MTVRLSLRAQSDLADIAGWISDRSEAAAVAVVEDLARAASGLEPSPERFALVEGFERQGLRRRVHGRYALFYVVRNEEVLVLRIVHGARDHEALLADDG